MKVLAYLFATTALVCAGPAIAQQAAGTQDDGAAASGQTSPKQASSDEDSVADIVVTAQRRAERVQDVPIAIAVVSGEQLARQQVVEIRDLQRTTASVTFGPPGGGSPGGGGVIRGIGTFGFAKGAEAAVGIAVDGVVQGNTNISNLFDIARVEVLRGPQGTLFGQSVSAGVINISTVAPDPNGGLNGRFSLELAGDGVLGSKFGRQIVRGAYNIPISANSALRVSGFANRVEGVTRNLFFNKNDELYEYGGRARFMATLGDNVTVNLSGDYSRSDQDYGTFFVYRSAVPGTEIANRLADCGVVPGVKSFTSCGSNRDRVSDTETFGGSGQVDIDLGSHTLTSITAYRKQFNDYQIDVDRLPGTLSLDILSQVQTDFKQFTQEVRLASANDGPFSYTVGGFYQKADTFNYQPSIVTVRPIPVLTIRSTSLKQQDMNVENLSAFGEGKLKFGALSVFAGARYTRSKVDQTASEAPTFPGTAYTSALEFKDNDISWRAGSQFEVSRDLMFFASAARGYKSAQINNEEVVNIVNNLPVLQPTSVVLPEKPMDYQIGMKSNWFNNRLAVNVNLFHTTVRNYQTIRCSTPTVDNPTPNCAPDNVSKVVTKGIEADIFGRPVRGLDLNGSFIYNVAKYPDGFLATSGATVAERNLAGQQIAFAPKWKATFSGEYSKSLGSQVEGFVAFDATYKGPTRMGIDRATPDFIYPETFVFGGRIGARVDDNWTLALFARNIGNTPIPTHFANPPTGLGRPATDALWQWQTQQSKRLVGLQADFTF